MRLNHHFNRLIFVCALIIIIAFNSCGYKQSSMGYQHRIFVVADSLLWAEVKAQVAETFESIVYTPQAESNYYITWIPLEKLNEFRTRMNIFILGVQNEAGETNEYLKKILPEEFKQGVADDSYLYIFKDNMFAYNQIGLIMFAKDRAAFKNNFEALKDEMLETFTKKYYARLKKGMFEKGELKDIESYLSKNFGWKVRLQHDYFIAIQDFEKNYVWLRRIQPNRWISIWKFQGDSATLNLDSLVQIRNEMAAKYYEGDVVVVEDTYLTETDFRGQRTKKVVGLWKSDSLMVGGPFRMYAVHDAMDSSIYFIDIAIMAPTKAKKPYLDQLEVIASTFEIIKNNN